MKFTKPLSSKSKLSLNHSSQNISITMVDMRALVHNVHFSKTPLVRAVKPQIGKEIDHQGLKSERTK